MSSSLFPESAKTMNNLDEPSRPLPIPEPEPWDLPSVSLLQSPMYTSFNSTLPSTSPSSPALFTSTPKQKKKQPGHQSRSTTSTFTISDGGGAGARPKRHGSIENIHRPHNYRSPLHFPSSKCDQLSTGRTGTKMKSMKAGGDRLESSSGTDEDGDTHAKTLVAVRGENKMLYTCLDDGRKALIVRKALNAFMYGALRRQSESLHLLQMRVKMKSEECAARLILHSLLLNSYRHTKRDLDAANAENFQHSKSVENLCLQLRVVRHLQTSEKEKIIEKGYEISTLKSEISLLKDEHERSQQKIQALEKQLYEEQNNNDKLAKDKVQIQDELRVLQEKIDLLNEGLKLEKKQAGKYLETSKQLKRQISEAKQQIKDLICQSSHWQERARSYESENCELEHSVKSSDVGYHELKQAFNELMDENGMLTSERETLLSQKSMVEAKLGETNNESMTLKRDLAVIKEKLEIQRMAGLELQKILKKCREDNLSLQDELFSYKVSHVRTRRSWIQFLMSIINPLETIRLFVCGPSNEVVASEIAATVSTSLPK